jgi:poly(A) polymerase
MLKWLFGKSQKKLSKADLKNIDPDALDIVSRLKRAGHETYLVGGCVRDLLLGKKPKDFDISTSATPNQVRHTIARSFVIGRRFRIVVAKRNGRSQTVGDDLFPHLSRRPLEKEFQITTFRREPELAGDKINENVFGTPKQDAERRDFTSNALFLDPTTLEIKDFVGGLDDLGRGVLRVIGNPSVRFNEDSIRILRALRFEARSELKIERKTWDALKAAAPSLKTSKMERIREELLKILREGHSKSVFARLDQAGLLATVLPGFEQAFQKNRKLHDRIFECLDAHPWRHPVQSPLFFLLFTPALMTDRNRFFKNFEGCMVQMKVSKAEKEGLFRIMQFLNRLERTPIAHAERLISARNTRLYDTAAQAFYVAHILAQAKIGPYEALWAQWEPHWKQFLEAARRDASNPSHQGGARSQGGHHGGHHHKRADKARQTQ